MSSRNHPSRIVGTVACRLNRSQASRGNASSASDAAMRLWAPSQSAGVLSAVIVLACNSGVCFIAHHGSPMV